MQKSLSADVCVAIPPALIGRVDEVAMAEFESRESIVATLLDAAIRHHRVPRSCKRDGGKPPAKSLLRPLKASSKRTRVLRWFLHSLDASVASAMAEFDLTRPAVFATWTVLNREHGIGYDFDAASDAVLVRLPCDEADIFGVA
jgi:hypothetical protein